MDHSNTISKFAHHLIVEEHSVERLLQSRFAKSANEAREHQIKILQGACRAEDIDLILKLERSYLVFELENYANSKAMHTSLTASIEELDVTTDLLVKVRNPEQYREVDESFSLKKNRDNDLPKDQARQFFSSQITRLINLDKAKVSDSEKDLIKCRVACIRVAQNKYKQLQRSALSANANRVNEKWALYAA